MRIDLYTSAFCAPCASARRTLAEAERLVPWLQTVEKDVVRNEEDAAANGIRSTPTVVLRDTNNAEVFRAEGAPRLDQVLTALAIYGTEPVSPRDAELHSGPGDATDC